MPPWISPLDPRGSEGCRERTSGRALWPTVPSRQEILDRLQRRKLLEQFAQSRDRGDRPDLRLDRVRHRSETLLDSSEHHPSHLIDRLSLPLLEAPRFRLSQPGLIHLPNLLVPLECQETTVLQGVLS